MFTRPLSIAALSQTAPYDTFLFRSAARPQIGDIGVRAAMIGAASFKVCAPDNDFADLARSSLRERAESYARAGRGGRGKSAKQRQG